MAFYEPNQPYGYGGANQPARANIVQPKWNDSPEKGNSVVIDSGELFSLTSDRYGDHDFVAELSNCQPLKLESTVVTWQYQNKNTAQDIVPFLYLGHMSAARDPAFILSNNITMLFAVRDGKAAALSPKMMDPARFASSQGIETKTFDVFDEFDFARNYRSAIKVMIDHLAAKSTSRPITQLSDVRGRILVFCEAGDKRSAILVILFFMVVFCLKADDAIQAVQARRYGIAVTGESERMLKSCEDLLFAERQVAGSRNITEAHTEFPLRFDGKRNAEQVRAEDEDMDDAYNVVETSRMGLAPFRDTQS